MDQPHQCTQGFDAAQNAIHARLHLYGRGDLIIGGVHWDKEKYAWCARICCVGIREPVGEIVASPKGKVIEQTPSDQLEENIRNEMTASVVRSYPWTANLAEEDQSRTGRNPPVDYQARGLGKLVSCIFVLITCLFPLWGKLIGSIDWSWPVAIVVQCFLIFVAWPFLVNICLDDPLDR